MITNERGIRRQQKDSKVQSSLSPLKEGRKNIVGGNELRVQKEKEPNEGVKDPPFLPTLERTTLF